MAALVLSTVMDGIAATITTAAAGNANVFAYPTEEAVAPCWIVGFPEEESELDATFRRGSDSTIFPVFFIAGRVSDQSARDQVSAALTLAKTSLDNNLGGTVQDARLAHWIIRWIELDTVSYVGIRFLLEVMS